MKFTITNNTGLDSDDVYIWFQNPITATFEDGGEKVESGKSYSVSEIGSGINMTKFISGRVFCSLGAPLPANTSIPQFYNTAPPADNNSFNNRHQLACEITLTPSPADTANLSTIDWITQTAALRNFDVNQKQLARLGFPENVDVSSLGANLRKLTSGGAVFKSSGNADGNKPTAYSKSGTGTPKTQNPASGSEVRILGPSQSFGLVQKSLTGYPSFKDYIASIIKNNQTAHLKATQDYGVGVYDLTATTSAATTPDWSLGEVTMKGSITPHGASKSETHTIVIPAKSLSDTTIYGGTTGSPSNDTPQNERKGIGYLLDGTPTDGGANTAATLAVRDYLAGLNYGFIGSSVINPNNSGKTYGESPSSLWGGKGLQFKGFSEVQPNNPFYNQWAEEIHKFSGGEVYGFSYDDVFAPVSIGVVQQDETDVARLDLELLPYVPGASS